MRVISKPAALMILRGGATLWCAPSLTENTRAIIFCLPAGYGNIEE
jgi:hypothetical protein